MYLVRHCGSSPDDDGGGRWGDRPSGVRSREKRGAELVHSFYAGDRPSIVPTSYGFLTESIGADRNRLVLIADSPDEVSFALSAAADFYGTRAFEVWIDDRMRAERMTKTLRSLGMHQVRDTVVLALVGAVRADPGPDGLTIKDVVDLA